MSLKLYFCGSIRAGQRDQPLYGRIITQLKEYGTVLTEHVAFPNVNEISERRGAKEVHDEDVKFLAECDALVAEVTQPSLGVGYEIGRAAAMNKKILCLFRSEDTPVPGMKLSCMVDGAHNGTNFIVKYYKEEEVSEILKEFLTNL